MRNEISKKQFVLGIDAMDPKLTAKYVKKGLMPNVKKLIELGSCREDLSMLGGHPTVTPPMWTTLACGCWPATHGITDFNYRLRGEELAACGVGLTKYGLDSRLCEAEQLWNVFAEAGKKTLVVHWPGSSWPPSSDNPNLHVIDGLQPGCINMGVAEVEKEFVMVASDKNQGCGFKEKAATDGNIPCVITDLKVEESKVTDFFALLSTDNKPKPMVILSEKDSGGNLGLAPFDVSFSQIKDADEKWIAAPKDAKEFVMLFSKGLIHHNGLILKNKNGIYDKIALYTNKRQTEPYIILDKNVYTVGVSGKAIRRDETFDVIRNMRLLDLSEDGTSFRMWISAAMDINNDSCWSPKRLYKQSTDKFGYPTPESNLGDGDRRLIVDCMIETWNVSGKWQADVVNNLIEEEDYDVVFSHFHNVDALDHMLSKFMKNRGNNITSVMKETDYQEFMEKIYIQTDNYIGEYKHLLEKGWTIYLVSDHSVVCPEHGTTMLGDFGINIPIMRELGYTYVIKDENGNDTREVDWSKTKAVASSIYVDLNLIGRGDHGIVDPKDQYELEEEIITALYNYKHPKTGKRVVSLALRKKDAIILGLGGEGCGDIVMCITDGYNIDHADCLTTTEGCADTTMLPIFIAAGTGIKQGYKTNRYIKQIDLAPTMAALGGVRMPKDCEGAPIYQIMTEVY